VKFAVRFWSLSCSLHWVFVSAMVAALYVLSLSLSLTSDLHFKSRSGLSQSIWNFWLIA
jgi:hypothetical protein